MIPAHLNSESGLPYPWFAVAALHNSDSRFWNFVGGSLDSIAGTTVDDKLQNLADANKLGLVDGGDNWYRAEIDTLGNSTDPEAWTLFYLDLVSGNTADEVAIIVTGDELVGSPDFQPELGSTDPITHPIELLASHISRTATFRTWCGLAANDPKASDKLLLGRNFARRIFQPAYYAPIVNGSGIKTPFPFCVIMQPESGALEMEKLTDDDVYTHSGALDFDIMDRSREGLDLERAERAFQRRIGFLLEELKRVDHANERLGIEALTVGISHGSPTPAEIATMGVFFTAKCQVAWSG